jgi:hypothetical protein
MSQAWIAGRDRLLPAVMVVAFVLSLAGGGRTAHAGDAAFGGYDAAASARAVSVSPSLPAFSVVEVPIEGTLALTQASITTGGLSFARSSTVWPGDLVAGLGPLIKQFSKEAGSAIPPWPLVVEAREYDGEKKNDKFPPASMKAQGTPDSSAAQASGSQLEVPGVLTIGSATSETAAAAVEGKITSKSAVRLHGISIMNGAITVDTVRSIASAASDAVKGETAGSTVVTGLVIGGVPASVDRNGVTANGQGPVPGVDPNEQLAQALESLGATVALTGGGEHLEGGSASRDAGGLLITIPTPGAGPVPPGTLTLILGGAVANASATTGLSIGGDTADVLDGSLPSSPVSAPAGSLTEFSAGASLPGIEPSSPPAAVPRGGATAPARTLTPAGAERGYDFGGVPMSLVLALAIATVLLARTVRTQLVKLLAPKE